VTLPWTCPLVALTALGLTLAGVPLAARLARRWNAIDYPGPRKLHVKPTPRLGGLAIFGAAILTLGFFLDGPVLWEGLAILGAGSLIALVGFLDDMGQIHSQVKLFFAMPLAALILMAAGIWAEVTPWTWFNVGITFLWVIGIICAFNLLDGMDGLAAGVSSIAALHFLILATLGHQSLTGLLAAAALGTSVGFLVYNFHPARIFMGDGGAMFLGFLMATLGLKIRVPDAPASVHWMLPVLVLGVPIFDTTLVTISRLRRGLIPFASPGKDHTFHRLHQLGWRQRWIVFLLYGVSGLFGAIAVGLVAFHPPWVAWVATVVGLTLAGGVAIALFERLPFEPQAGVRWREVWKTGVALLRR
jgi:UDP-GlcNAc:undecaprenyl-phosphate GlcNAc-1-phosphate transferase